MRRLKVQANFKPLHWTFIISVETNAPMPMMADVVPPGDPTVDIEGPSFPALEMKMMFSTMSFLDAE
jgi:hypothetical protein